MPDLETIDLDGVEILAAGGPIHGIGSPPEGDTWTPEQLRGMAAAAADLGDEVKPPAKIGHKGGDPAVGWLENIRVNAEGDKLLADIKKVPKGLSKLLEVGAYRTRSVELAKITSQKTGRQHDWVVTGLAWLGGKMPAVRTLADVVKLYDGDAERLFVTVDEHEPALSERLLEAVIDLALAAASGNPGVSLEPSDSRPGMPVFTEEQRRKFADATGLEPDKVTDELLAAAGLTEPTDDDDESGRELETSEIRRELETVKNEAAEARKQADRANEDLRLERRRSFVDGLARDGKIAPGDREKWETRFDRDPELAREFAAELTTDPSFVREYGSDDDDTGETDDEKTERRKFEHEQVAAMVGIDSEAWV